MAVIIRALVYATLFVSFVLILVPARLLPRTALTRPETFGFVEVGGFLLAGAGAAIALWCVLVFAIRGRGTPAPFDPPRRLVVRGPYMFVRNPMYIGAGMALAGAALIYRSPLLVFYLLLLLGIVHLFIIFYEEPTLRRTFGAEYDECVARVSRWLPRLPQT